MHKMKSFCRVLGIIFACLCLATISLAQVSVTTYHNDNARTGANTRETILTPANVNSTQFGKLFSTAVDGWVYAQPLYVPNLTISGGSHNVLFVATEHDSVYAIDADNGTIYWQLSLLPSGGVPVNSNTDLGCSDLVPEVGITGTPVIDSTTRTLYVVAKSKVFGSYFQYLHALDLVTHAEKFGGPVKIQATVSGTGDGGTTVSFDAFHEAQRPGLLLQNGHVIIGWASHCDHTPYHGWVMSYSAANIQTQEAVHNTSPNGGLSGIWMSGGGLAGDSAFNTYYASGNGTYDGAAKSDFGDSIVKLGPPSGGTFPVLDWFTPYNQNSLSGGDTDVGSGGLVLLPDLPTGSAHQQMLTQMGKEGKMYVVDRNNMGKFCSSCTNSDTQIVEEIPGATNGIWGAPAYWNGFVYWGGGADGGGPQPIKAFSFNANNSGLISTSPVSQTAKSFSFSTPVPSLSSNGTSNGILWGLDDSAFGSSCCQVLYAYDATNLGTMLYNSSQAAGSRDVPGGAVKYATPTIANGKVYVGSQFKVSGYGPITTTPTVATPTFSPAPGSYTSSINVTLSDSTSGAAIHCTTDGSTPTPSSPVCNSVTISATTTLKAIGTLNGYNNSAVASGTYLIGSGSGINFGSGFSNTGLQLNGTAILNGTRLQLNNISGTNEAGSAFYTTPIGVQNFTNDFSFQLTSASADGFTFTLQGTGATALGPSGGGLGYGPDTIGGTGGIPKSVAVKFDLYNNNGEGTDSTGLYVNGASPTTPFVDMTSSGVVLASGDTFNVHMTYDGATLKMTITDAVQPTKTFTTSWSINIPSTIGSTTAFAGFTGGTGGLTAIQEILNWTYTSVLPTASTPTFNPQPGNYSSAQSVTITDSTPGAAIYYTTDGSTPSPSSTRYTAPVTISATTTLQAIAVASGYANSAVAKGVYTISSGSTVINYGSGFTTSGLTFNGSAKLNGTRLRLTDGGGSEAGSAFYNTAVNVQSFSSDFTFQLTNPNADGITFVLQNSGTTALGQSGGFLGYNGIPTSIAVKFDLYDNSGEGVNSTGLYTNGASPTVPAITLGGGVNLHSGDPFNVHFSYNGTTLSMTITDANVPSQTFTTSWTVNIPATIGSNTAFAGFTGGTGGATAIQEILTWVYRTGAAAPIRYEAVNTPVTGSPNARAFTWTGFPDGAGEITDGTAAGAFLNFTINVALAGTYDVKVGTKQYPTRGIFQLSVNGVTVGSPQDEYSANTGGVFREYDLGTVSIGAAGTYQFDFVATGKNAASSGYTLTYDYIQLTPQ